MSKVKDKLIADLTERFGPSSKAIVDYLFDAGTLDDSIAKGHVLKLEYVKRMVNYGYSERQVQSGLDEDYGVHRRQLQRLTEDTGALLRMATK